jgi:hypothetical protein
MKAVRNFVLCTIVAIGFACNATAAQEDKEDKKADKEKIEIIDEIPYPMTDKPFSVPDAGSTLALWACPLLASGWRGDGYPRSGKGRRRASNDSPALATPRRGFFLKSGGCVEQVP